MFTSTLKRRFQVSPRSRRCIRRRRSLTLGLELLEDRAVPSSVKFGFAFGLGSAAFDTGQIATDRFGNFYVTGSFSGTVDFDPGPGTFNLVSSASDHFVAKYSNVGAPLWAKDLGPYYWSYGNPTGLVASDDAGNVYVAGYIPSVNGSSSYSISKLDSNGNLMWTDQVGPVAVLYAIAVDGGGNVYGTGYFQGTPDFDPGPGTFTLTGGSYDNGIPYDVFVSKLDTNGNFVWARDIASGGVAFGKGIAVDGGGNVYATGYFLGTVDFDPGPGTFDLTVTPNAQQNNVNVFVSKLDSNGNFIWAKQLGTGGTAYSQGIAVDGSGNVITTGTFNGGLCDFDPGPATYFLANFDLTRMMFMSKLDSNGNFVWAKSIGNPGTTSGNGNPAVDNADNIYTTGIFSGTVDFDPGPGTFDLTATPNGNRNVFVSKLNSNGKFLWAEQLDAGGSTLDRPDGYGIALDSAGNVFTTGAFFGTADFDPGPGTYFLTSSGSFNNIFVSKLTIVDRLIVTNLPSSMTAGNAFTFDVTAKDSDGNTVTSYLGMVHFTSSDAQAVLPPDYTFTSTDSGHHTFSAILKTAGSESLTATDSVSVSITGSGSVTVNPTAAGTLVLTGYPSPTTAGVAHNFTVTARDIFGNTATGYTGSIAFSSTDSQSVLPANYTFTSNDAGVHAFSATLKTVGSQSIMATDTVTNAMTASQTGIRVNPAAASKLVLSGYPSPASAGVPHSFTVTAQDAFGNIASGYTGTIAFGSSDSQAVLPANYKFTGGDAGVHTFSATLNTAGSQSITATDTVTSSIQGGQTGITVTAASQLGLSGYPSTTTAGVPHSFTVTAQDAFGNIASGYTGTIAFGSSDSQAVLPANYTFTALDAGIHTFSAILKTPGSQSITATDAGSGSITGAQTVTVNPAGVVATSIVVSGYPSPDTAGTAHNFTITVTDAHGYIVIGYTGTVTFSSSDAKAVLPANYTFTSADYGVHVFSAILRTAGSQTITATDTVNSSITGSQSITVNPAATDHLVVSRFPSKTTAGVTQGFRITAQDRYGNTTPSFADTVSFSSSDSRALLPGSYTFTSGDAGIHNFSATLITAGSQSITAQDLITSAVASGTQSGIVVNPAAASHLQVAGFPPSVLAGSAHNFTVTALDPYSNIATGYRGTVAFSSTDSQSVLPASYPFTSADAGLHTFSATLNTVGINQWISATDTVNAGISGMESGISVVPVQPTASVTGPAPNLSGSAGIPSQLLTFIFGASESGLPAGTVYSYSVQWGDGSAVQTLSGPSGTQATHVYVAAGTYTTGVTAADPSGHASLLASTSVLITAVAMETDPYNSSLTALYVGGTTGNDNIAITPVAGGGVKVGMNYVNYGSFFPTGHVIVYSQSGNDIIKTAAQTLGGVLTYVNVPLLIFAGNGNDILNVTGSSAGNVLVGGAGTDRLIGGQGRDILIGGSGPSTLNAGNRGDILIGGTTSYDGNAAALAAVLAEWGRTDADYTTRIAHLTGSSSGGLNGGSLLNASTVHSDGLVNNLYGGAGLDWYFAGVADVLFNRTSGEVVTPV